MSVFAALAMACATVLFLFEPGHYGFYPRCLLYQMTGLLCPGCGSLRALHQLLHGHFLAALHLNALLVLCTPLVLFVGLRAMVRQWKGEPRMFAFPVLLLWGFLAVLIVFALMRNLPFAHALWLAP